MPVIHGRFLDNRIAFNSCYLEEIQVIKYEETWLADVSGEQLCQVFS